MLMMSNFQSINEIFKDTEKEMIMEKEGKGEIEEEEAIGEAVAEAVIGVKEDKEDKEDKGGREEREETEEGTEEEIERTEGREEKKGMWTKKQGKSLTTKRTTSKESMRKRIVTLY